MPSYLTLPPIPVVATADQSGFNSGNWTCGYTSSVMSGINVPAFELYGATVQNAQIGSAFVIGFDLLRTWGGTSVGAGGTTQYAPPIGWLLDPSQEFYVFFNYAASGTAPQICCWFRYDAEHVANRPMMGLRGL